MFSWFLITHNLKATQQIVHRIQGLGAEVFSPIKVTVTKRTDCNGVRTRESQLFPGYLFVRLDPEVVHTSEVLSILGVEDFVRFGGVLATISEPLMDALKMALLIRADRKISQIEYRNVHPEMLARFEEITLIKSKPDRQVAFFDLLLAEQKFLHSRSPHSRIVSTIDRPFVNDLIS